MIGVYFSGPGNTRFCMEEFMALADSCVSGGKVCSIEEERAAEAIREERRIVLAYPVYYSSLPKIVRDFIIDHAELWQGKEVFVIATMGLFSGDGAGLLGQRLWFCGKTRSYTDRLKIDQKACCGCGLCAKLCLMDNLSLVQGKAQAGDRCTMCYRCINRCPERAITLLGRKVLGQERVEDYLRSRK